MNFEDYLSESVANGTFAIKFLGKWAEEQKLPYKDVHSILKAVESEKEDLSSITAWFQKHMRVSGGKAVIEDMTAKAVGNDSVEVEISWSHNVGATAGQIQKTKITISKS